MGLGIGISLFIGLLFLSTLGPGAWAGCKMLKDSLKQVAMSYMPAKQTSK